ncbi:MAG TPA: hypothetical protein VH419_06880 [Nocardioidaceae bacterium]
MTRPEPASAGSGAHRARSASVEQATVWSFDETTRQGEVVFDDGRRLRFDAEAFAASGLRLLRAGQRVRLERDGDAVRRLTVLTLP